MFVTVNRVLVIDRKENRLRIKNGEVFFTAFMSKKMPPLPDSVKEGSQITVSGFIKSSVSEKYGLQYSLTATAVVELNPDSNRAKSTTTEPGEPISTAPEKQ
jgi:hypothetical protein